MTRLAQLTVLLPLAYQGSLDVISEVIDRYWWTHGQPPANIAALAPLLREYEKFGTTIRPADRRLRTDFNGSTVRIRVWRTTDGGHEYDEVWPNIPRKSWFRSIEVTVAGSGRDELLPDWTNYCHRYAELADEEFVKRGRVHLPLSPNLASVKREDPRARKAFSSITGAVVYRKGHLFLRLTAPAIPYALEYPPAADPLKVSRVKKARLGTPPAMKPRTPTGR